jgi:hypothetical protein
MDSLEPGPGASVTLVFKGWSIRQPQKGAYRIDTDPPRLHVREGEVEVTVAAGGTPVSVGPGMDLPFAAVLAPDPSSGEPHDGLGEWSDGRAESISADNAIAANIQDPANMSGPGSLADSFTYFPMLGLPTFGSVFAGSLDPYASSVYGLSNPYQVGFYSIYLPGYTRRPLLLGLPPVGLTHSLYTSSPIGPRFPVIGAPGLHAPVLGAPGPRLPGLRPPAAHPVTPAPHAPAAHIGGHR